MIVLGENRYGKSRVRLMKVERNGEFHEVYEWDVAVWLKGDFSSCFENGDNSSILPTDTMKNTVYSLARKSTSTAIEDFAKEVVSYFIANNPQVDEAGVHIKANSWKHIGDHPTAFVRSGPAVEIATVTYSRKASISITSGFENLSILKTTNSEFAGYIKGHLTTLKETSDRLLGTQAEAEWKYAASQVDLVGSRRKIMEALLNTFAAHHSLSVQQTLFAMGKAALEAAPEISEIRLSMPNKHCNLVDLSAFGQDNPNYIFVPTDEPHGSIEACVRRSN